MDIYQAFGGYSYIVVVTSIPELDFRRQHYNSNGLGYADFFPVRYKRKLLSLADAGPHDVFYDLGCGDASLLIFAVEQFHVGHAVGFENNPVRNRIATRRVKEAALSERIEIRGNMLEADLSQADIIFDMLPEAEDDYEVFYSSGVREGTRLIKHDLPLVGFLHDAADYPFCMMTFPLRKAASKSGWAASVLFSRDAAVDEVWNELYYYQREKRYFKTDIRRLQRILSKRLSKDYLSAATVDDGGMLSPEARHQKGPTSDYHL